MKNRKKLKEKLGDDLIQILENELSEINKKKLSSLRSLSREDRFPAIEQLKQSEEVLREILTELEKRYNQEMGKSVDVEVEEKVPSEV